MKYVNWLAERYNEFYAWYSAGGDGPYKLWLYGGVAAVAAFLAFFYYSTRRILGHRKFRGTWYNDKQWQALLLMTHEDQERGNRVMRHDEIALLRKWQLGYKKGFGKDSGWGL